MLSDRISQLQTLADLISRDGIPSEDFCFYIGKSSKEERSNAPSKRLLLSTYSMSREALYIPALDTLVMASPTGDVEQAFGRILRKYPGKQIPLVVDVIDPYSIFESMRWKRARYYKAQLFSCQTIAASQMNPDFFA